MGYPGPDPIASWLQRNLRIYHNIRALIEIPDERVLVIYGYGHLGSLRQVIAGYPLVELKRLSDLSR